MKKAVLILLILTFSCQQDTVEVDQQNAHRDQCTDLSGYPASGWETQAEWLRKSGNNVCEAVLYAAINQQHLITKPSDITFLTGNSLQLSVSSMNTYMGSDLPYDYYIGFQKTGNDITGITKNTLYTQSQPYYSVGLFRTMISLQGMVATDYFIFRNGSLSGGAATVIIEVHAGSNVSFYDISLNPL